MHDREPKTVLDTTAPHPLTGLPPSVCFDAIEALQAADQGRLGCTTDGRLSAVVSNRVNEARHRFFDPALKPQLIARGLIMEPSKVAPWAQAKVKLTPDAIEALPVLVVWAALMRDPESADKGSLADIIGAEVAATLNRDLEGVVAKAEGNTIKIALHEPADFIAIDFSADLDQLDEELKP